METIPPGGNGSKDVRVVERIALLLAQLNEAETNSLKELAVSCGLAISTTSRLLDSLERVGYVERDRYSKRYRLGPGLLRLAGTNRQRREIVGALRPVLEWLTQETGEDSGLAELHDTHAVIIDRVDGIHPLKIIERLGGPQPLYGGAFRKVLLSYQDDAWITHYIESITFRQFTPRTITSSTALWQEIANIRAQGYATSYGEILPDGGGIAVPVRDYTGKVRAAVQIVVPVTRLTESRTGVLVEAVMEAGSRADLILGGSTYSRHNDRTRQGAT